MIEIGTLDRITGVFGERGVGKSTYTKIDSINFQRQTGGIVIGHSPNGQIGWEEYIEFHDDLRSLEKALNKRPELMHFVAAGASPEEVFDFGRAMALELRRVGHKVAGHKFHPHRPAPKGTMATPVLIVIDEGTHTEQREDRRWKKPGDDDGTITVREKKELEKALTSARHENFGVTFLTQAPTSRSWVYTEQSNRARLFRYMHEYGLNGLRAAGFVPKEEVSGIRALPKFQYWNFDKDTPHLAGYRKLPDPD